MNDFKNYYPGQGCKCGAYWEGECACDVDWTSKLEKVLKFWESMPP